MGRFILSVIMGVAVAGIGMGVMHDAVHGSYSKKRWVNKLFGGTLYLLGSNVFNWEVQHNIMHHTHTNVGGIDEDIDTKGPIRLCEHAQLKQIHKFQYIYAFFFYSLMTIVKLFKEFPQLARYNKLGITKKNGINPTVEYIKMVIYKIAYLL
jgi:linoleoyl-CoA desaturase